MNSFDNSKIILPIEAPNTFRIPILLFFPQPDKNVVNQIAPDRATKIEKHWKYKKDTLHFHFAFVKLIHAIIQEAEFKKLSWKRLFPFFVELNLLSINIARLNSDRNSLNNLDKSNKAIGSSCCMKRPEIEALWPIPIIYSHIPSEKRQLLSASFREVSTPNRWTAASFSIIVSCCIGAKLARKRPAGNLSHTVGLYKHNRCQENHNDRALGHRVL